MTPNEIAARLRDPKPCRIALDTNVIGGHWGGFKGFAARCQDVLRARAQCGHRGDEGFRLFVSALVHAEVLYDLRLSHGPKFKPRLIDAGLQSLEVVIEPFERADGEALATRLYDRFPNADAWNSAKWSRVRVGEESRPGRSCPATVDWWIGSHTRGDDRWIISGDKGIEFESLQRVSAAEFDRALQLLLDV